MPKTGDKALPRSPAALAPRHPSLTHLLLEVGVPGRRPRVRLRPRAARARLLRGPCATAPRSRLGSAPVGSGSPRHRGGRRLFLQRPPPRPSPDVKRGGGCRAGAGGGTRRPAQEGAATRCDLLVPTACRRARSPAPARWGERGTPDVARGKQTHMVCPRCLTRPTAAGRPGSGRGLRADQVVCLLAPMPTGPCNHAGTGLPS